MLRVTRACVVQFSVCQGGTVFVEGAVWSAETNVTIGITLKVQHGICIAGLRLGAARIQFR